MSDETLRKIPASLDRRPFSVAEMSGNHNQSLDTALRIVTAAVVAGVDALKLQTYDPKTLTLDLSVDKFVIDDKDSL